jgi:hypothetical protein
VYSTWEFQSLLAFRDAFAEEYGFELIAYVNQEGRTAFAAWLHRSHGMFLALSMVTVLGAVAKRQG